ncbi:redoxin domain-containing protein [Natronorubrum sp. JWXQ-INN-674]|uniref:Redoxin domain-containing protein n=1 Tax=Natronorubrum halalkaliphilum TaxID=2691917 RepID=A0A6B0VK37_9EURY|nr:redoxin domain-containing protein [Natronorubrum halalkaliphilum]MXV61914.1 redoxin domain-containing protein [Natronorubrum halalkaliphilum]
MSRVSDFSLTNVAAGPDPFTLSELDDDVAFVVLFFQRDHYCTNCRSQVQDLADRIEAFHERDAEVVSIVPEPGDRVEEWQSRYELPYPLLADPDASVGDDYDQPVRFGILGAFSDFFGRMPAAVIVDRRGDEPVVAATHRGRSTFDRPDIDELLAELDELRSA